MQDTDRILDKLDDLTREVSDLRVAVAKLESRIDNAAPSKPGFMRDGGITVSGGAIGAIVLSVIQHFAKAP